MDVGPQVVTPDRSCSRGWTWAVTAFVVAWLAVQLVVPVVRIVERGGAPRPRTFGWQMFSHQLADEPEAFAVTTAEGTQPVDVGDLVARPLRREVIYAPAVIDALCERPGVLAVEVTDVELGVRTEACR